MGRNLQNEILFAILLNQQFKVSVYQPSQQSPKMFLSLNSAYANVKRNILLKLKKKTEKAEPHLRIRFLIVIG